MKCFFSQLCFVMGQYRQSATLEKLVRPQIGMLALLRDECYQNNRARALNKPQRQRGLLSKYRNSYVAPRTWAFGIKIHPVREIPMVKGQGPDTITKIWVKVGLTWHFWRECCFYPVCMYLLMKRWPMLTNNTCWSKMFKSATKAQSVISPCFDWRTISKTF